MPSYCVPGGVMRALIGSFTEFYSFGFNTCFDAMTEFPFDPGVDCNNSKCRLGFIICLINM